MAFVITDSCVSCVPVLANVQLEQSLREMANTISTLTAASTAVHVQAYADRRY